MWMREKRLGREIFFGVDDLLGFGLAVLSLACGFGVVHCGGR